MKLCILNSFIPIGLIGLERRKHTIQSQLQERDSNEDTTLNIIESTNHVNQIKGTNKRNAMKKVKIENHQNVKTALKTKQQQSKQKRTVQSLLQKSGNKENTTANIIEPTNQTKKTKNEHEKLCVALENSTMKNHQEVKTAHNTRYKQSINHMPGTDHKKRVRCKFEGCKLTSSYYCMECNVHLCIKSDAENTQEKNCFLKYHTLPE